MEKELEEWHKMHKFYFYAGDYKTKDLAMLLNISPRTIQRWIRGKSKPTQEQLSQIRRYLDLRKTT